MSRNNLVIVRGTISGEARRTTLASGGTVHQYDVRVVDDDADPPTRTSTVPVSWFDPPPG